MLKGAKTLNVQRLISRSKPVSTSPPGWLGSRQRFAALVQALHNDSAEKLVSKSGIDTVANSYSLTTALKTSSDHSRRYYGR